MLMSLLSDFVAGLIYILCGGSSWLLLAILEEEKLISRFVWPGIIRKTRTVMECLHRFCRECIDKSMRLGNNECPACRTHCASRRSLRDDPNYDALIAALYPDIDKYEEEELAFHEEEKTRNKQIQASIAQTFRRQTEALGRRRTPAAFVRRSQSNYYRNPHMRGRRNFRGSELQGSDDDVDANGNDGGKDSSSADEHCTDVKQKRCRRWGGPRFSLPSSAAANADGGCDENDLEVSRESISASPGLVGNPEVLVWGKGGVRSHTRYGSASGGGGRNARSSRLTKLVDYLRNLEGNDDEYVALQTSVKAEEVEILVVKEPCYTAPDQYVSALNPSTSTDNSMPKSRDVNPCKGQLQILEAQETLARLQANCTSSRGHLILAYRQKVSS
ncbi:hypothetical protein HHK36_023625 [Tetracentron sinense]|uniref:RING-type domain-containing protein n=1 Tax=Tetracentron sinense TaxID=13715 RepID=A0A835D610_TETSI|nr:hypothetical protein HHK36_023625 [Tetracentron sinense]